MFKLVKDELTYIINVVKNITYYCEILKLLMILCTSYFSSIVGRSLCPWCQRQVSEPSRSPTLWMCNNCGYEAHNELESMVCMTPTVRGHHGLNEREFVTTHFPQWQNHVVQIMFQKETEHLQRPKIELLIWGRGVFLTCLLTLFSLQVYNIINRNIALYIIVSKL